MMKKLLCLFGVLLFSIGTVQAQGNISGGSPLTLITTTSATPPTNTTDTADGTDFGTVVAGEISGEHDFVFTSTTASTLAITVELLGPDASEFLDSAPVPSTTNGVGITSTFKVTFRPDASSTVNDVKSAWVHVRSGQPPFGSPFEDYYFLIQGTVGAAAPSIEVFDNETLVLANGGIDPFGIAVGSIETITRQYTIENSGSAPLTINSITNSFGDAQFVVLPLGIATPFDIPAATGGSPGSFTFSVSFTPDQPDTQGFPDINYFAFIVIDTETVDDSVSFPTDPTDFFFQVTGVGIAPAPDMDVLGNGLLIQSGDITPDPADDTDFGFINITGGGIAKTYTIENNGTANLVLTSLAPIVDITGADASDFTVTTDPTPTTITPGNSVTFIVTFDPTTPGQKDATVEIRNSDTANDPYTFDITGLATTSGSGNTNQLLITQYYEGTGANDNWIEVKNISAVRTLPNAYHLALYEDLEGTTSGFISTSSPTVSVDIPALDAGEVVLFRRGGGASINLGPASIEPDTEVCRFDGNDIVLISISNGTSCYNDRIDIMGVVGGASAITWGVDTSLIKGCGTDEVPTAIYDPVGIAYDANQYIELTLTEVATANILTNIAIGTQTVGAMTWTTSWGGVEIPDKTKDVIIDGTYNNANGSFESCNLTVNTGATINLDSGGAGSNYILVAENLTVNGSFIIGDTEALITVNPVAIMSGSIEKREVTTALNNFRDFTYWSSPVSTTIASAFSGVTPNRIFQWDVPTTSPDFQGDWSIASGAMTAARGYISEAPSGTPDGGTHAVSFTGTPNNGTINIDVGNNNDGFDDTDFNLIGNPYPSAINIDNFIESTSNNDIDGTIWLWTHNTTISNGTTGEFSGLDYATYNLTGGTLGSPSGSPVPTFNIGSAQGFFVRALNDGPVFFENSMRLSGQNTQFFRTSNEKTTTEVKDRVWLNVESNTGGAFSQLLVGFLDDATDGFDRGYDGTGLGANWISFYSKIDTLRYAIQGLSSFNLDKKVAIGFDTYIPDALTYKISIYNAEGALDDNDIYLVDNELGIVHDLKQADYEFDVNGEGEFPNRFVLQFTNAVLAVDNLKLDADFVIINEDNSLRLRTNTVITQLKVYDMMGRLLIDAKPNDTEFSINTQTIRKGTVLIVNATFDNGAEVSKKAIKY